MFDVPASKRDFFQCFEKSCGVLGRGLAQLSLDEVQMQILRARTFASAVALIAALHYASKAAAAEVTYRIDSGDTIEISVAGLPELRQRVIVQPDGVISFPLLGELSARNLTPAQLRTEVQTHLANKLYRQRAADGHEIPVVIQREEVSASVVDYRPIYVNGDVAKPGQIAFRPFMTVRQVISLVGGFDQLAARTPNALVDAASLNGDIQLLEVDRLKEQAHVSRVLSEIAGRDLLGEFGKREASGAISSKSKFLAIEADVLRNRLEDYRREKAYLQEAIARSDAQYAALEKQQREEEQGTVADTQELKKLIDLFDRGTVPSPRVIDARRALLLSSTRTLQITSQLLVLQKQRADSVRQLERYEDQRRLALQGELQAANQALDSANIRLASAHEKMRYIAMARSQSTDRDTHPDIQVFRREQAGFQRLPARMTWSFSRGMSCR